MRTLARRVAQRPREAHFRSATAARPSSSRSLAPLAAALPPHFLPSAAPALVFAPRRPVLLAPLSLAAPLAAAVPTRLEEAFCTGGREQGRASDQPK
eukprot:714115-Rhodomonas_salina.2